MIREISQQEVPRCVDVIRKSFSTVAKEFALRKKMVQDLLHFQQTKEELTGIYRMNIDLCMVVL